MSIFTKLTSSIANSWKLRWTIRRLLRVLKASERPRWRSSWQKRKIFSKMKISLKMRLKSSQSLIFQKRNSRAHSKIKLWSLSLFKTNLIWKPMIEREAPTDWYINYYLINWHSHSIIIIALVFEQEARIFGVQVRYIWKSA